MNAVRAGWLTYNERALVPSEAFPWDDYASRLFRYALYDAYDNNTAYADVQRFSAGLKRASDLYRHTRGIYNPVARLVESYVDKVYAGALDFETLATGAIPIVFANEAQAAVLTPALRNLWLWSNVRVLKDVYVRVGVKYGDVFLKVVDDPQRAKVRLEVLHPAKVKSVDLDAVGNVKRAEIEYERTDERGSAYTYTEILEKDFFETRKDGEPFAFVQDGEGRAVARWNNPYGFIPLVFVKHRNVGMQWGVNAFHAQLRKIDEVNDAASLLNDALRRAVNPMLLAVGFAANRKLEVKLTERDEVPILYAPDGTDVRQLVPNVDAAAAGANLDRMLRELERDLPELALHRLREGGNLTAPGVRSAYSDAISRYRSAMGTYDDGLVRAHKMALTIGALRRYPGFDRIAPQAYERGELEHYIRERPVVEDALSLSERVQVLMRLPENPNVARLILQELNYANDQVDAIVTSLTQMPMAQAGGDELQQEAVAQLNNLLEEIGV